MIQPAPTSAVSPGVARGTLISHSNGIVAIAFPNTSYEVHLSVDGVVTTDPGKRIAGKIRLSARRIDISRTGGKYVEPVVGRLTRVQGKVVAVEGDTLVVDAAIPVHLVPTERGQKPSDFQVGDFVTCNVKSGGTFTPSVN